MIRVYLARQAHARTHTVEPIDFLRQGERFPLVGWRDDAAQDIIHRTLRALGGGWSLGGVFTMCGLSCFGARIF